MCPGEANQHVIVLTRETHHNPKDMIRSKLFVPVSDICTSWKRWNKMDQMLNLLYFNFVLNMGVSLQLCIPTVWLGHKTEQGTGYILLSQPQCLLGMCNKMHQ